MKCDNPNCVNGKDFSKGTFNTDDGWSGVTECPDCNGTGEKPESQAAQGNELLDNIVDFMQSEKNALMDHVVDDLAIKVDYECSNLYDMVDERFTDKSFQEIIDAVVFRVCNAIQSYKEKNDA